MALEVNPFLPIGSHSPIHWLFAFSFPSNPPYQLYHPPPPPISQTSFLTLILYVYFLNGKSLCLLPGYVGFSPSLGGCRRICVEHRKAATFPCFSVTVYKVKSSFYMQAFRQFPPATLHSSLLAIWSRCLMFYLCPLIPAIAPNPCDLLRTLWGPAAG